VTSETSEAKPDRDATSDEEPPSDHLSVSTRDEGELRDRLEAWLIDRPDVGPGASVDSFERPEANGMSSETLLFDASWDRPQRPPAAGGGDGGGGGGGGARECGQFVIRMTPADDAFPVFPSYDLERQVRVMRLVGERSSAPVPVVHWYEADEAPLGAPFFVMDRVGGQVPPDVMPYPFDGTWVQTASPEQRDRLQAASVDVLAAIHGIEASADELGFLRGDPPSAIPPGAVPADDGGDTALRRHFAQERAYYEWVRGDLRFPVVERALDWLEAHWPHSAEQAPTVVCWGDARIGNILYQDFQPQAVLDWEMATVGPRELDVGWFIFLHRFFQDIASDFGMAGLPDFLQPHAVAAQYAERSGHELRDLDWFVTYAATRHGSIMARTMWRRIQFGEAEMPDDPEDLILHRRTIQALIQN
jgi:aminoglycoside phosphotransferase (APT) family kinase protein